MTRRLHLFLVSRSPDENSWFLPMLITDKSKEQLSIYCFIDMQYPFTRNGMCCVVSIFLYFVAIEVIPGAFTPAAPAIRADYPFFFRCSRSSLPSRALFVFTSYVMINVFSLLPSDDFDVLHRGDELSFVQFQGECISSKRAVTTAPWTVCIIHKADIETHCLLCNAHKIFVAGEKCSENYADRLTAILVNCFDARYWLQCVCHDNDLVAHYCGIARWRLRNRFRCGSETASLSCAAEEFCGDHRRAKPSVISEFSFVLHFWDSSKTKVVRFRYAVLLSFADDFSSFRLYWFTTLNSSFRLWCRPVSQFTLCCEFLANFFA